jgi:nicotinate-nucleotide adenylyltransferase
VRLRPLAHALRVAAAGRDRPPSLTLAAGDLAGATRLGLLAGTFNPLTTAHAALAEAARDAGCDRVLLAMAPVSLAKETVERAHALDRLDWLVDWARGRPWTAVAVASHPLLVDMVEAAARLLGDDHRAEIVLLLGSDKAAQIADPRWYDDPDAAHARLARLASALVAVRAGPPVELATLPFPAAPLPTPGWTLDRSATEARAEAARGHPLAGLVPDEVAVPALHTGAYAADPGPYLARADALHNLVEES